MNFETEKYGKPVTVRFPEGELKFLDANCEKLHMTRSEVIRNGVPSISFLYQFRFIVNQFLDNTRHDPASRITPYGFVTQNLDSIFKKPDCLQGKTLSRKSDK